VLFTVSFDINLCFSFKTIALMTFVLSCSVGKVSDATAALGRTVAPHIRRHSTKLLPESLTRSTTAGGSSKFDDGCDIAASGLKGLHRLIIVVVKCIAWSNLLDYTILYSVFLHFCFIHFILLKVQFILSL